MKKSAFLRNMRDPSNIKCLMALHIRNMLRIMTQYTHKHKYLWIYTHTHAHTHSHIVSFSKSSNSKFILITPFLNPYCNNSFLNSFFFLLIKRSLFYSSTPSHCFGFKPQEKNKFGKIFPSWTKS